MKNQTQKLDNEQRTGVWLLDTVFEPVQARQSDLSAWRISNTQLNSLDVDDCKLSHWRADAASYNDLTCEHCLCEHGHYVNCRFENSSLKSCFWTESHFAGCELHNTVGELTSFGLSSFERTTLIGSRLSEVAFIGSFWHDCEFRDEQYDFVRFPCSLFVNTRFINCTLRKVIFRKARFINCRFESCTLPESIFHNAELTNTVFEKTDLHEAANLDGIKGIEL